MHFNDQPKFECKLFTNKQETEFMFLLGKQGLYYVFVYIDSK